MNEDSATKARISVNPSRVNARLDFISFSNMRATSSIARSEALLASLWFVMGSRGITNNTSPNKPRQIELRTLRPSAKLAAQRVDSGEMPRLFLPGNFGKKNGAAEKLHPASSEADKRGGVNLIFRSALSSRLLAPFETESIHQWLPCSTLPLTRAWSGASSASRRGGGLRDYNLDRSYPAFMDVHFDCQ